MKPYSLKAGSVKAGSTGVVAAAATLLSLGLVSLGLVPKENLPELTIVAIFFLDLGRNWLKRKGWFLPKPAPTPTKPGGKWSED